MVVVLLAVARVACAQDHAAADHSRMHAVTGVQLPTLPGQDAFGAIAEVVQLLRADPTTDWSRVDVEALRSHLIDMNAVTLRSVVRQTSVPGGVEMVVTGDSSTAQAIRRMTTSHGAALGEIGLLGVSAPIRGGARFTVTAANAADSALVAQLRGLGFAGIMTLSNHHAAHHLAIARGLGAHGHS
jgi:hypothetical protein